MIYNIAKKRNELTSDAYGLLSKFGKISFDLLKFKNYLLIERNISCGSGSVGEAKSSFLEVTFDNAIKFQAINGEWTRV